MRGCDLIERLIFGENYWLGVTTQPEQSSCSGRR
jgi:hypothetical protein